MPDPQSDHRQPGVAFYLSREFHRPILEPVRDELGPDVRSLVSSDVEEVIAFRPAVLAMAHAVYERFEGRLPETIMVFTRHGFASKELWERAFAQCDFACVSSPWVREDLLRRGIRPQMGYWVTGFMPMDKVLRSADRTPPPGFALGASPGPRTLLYAPTHNPGLHSFPVIGTRWIRDLQAAVPGLNIVIKPHPLTPVRNPEWMAAWRQAAAGSSRVLLVEDTHSDVHRFFPMADVLLTDVSSVAFYFLAMDRPIVLVDPRHPEGVSGYDPDGPEWQWRDMATAVREAAELVPAVQRVLADPGERADRRRFYRERVFGEFTDGHACRRLAERIRALLRPEAERPDWAEVAWNSLRFRGRRAAMVQDLNSRSYLTGRLWRLNVEKFSKSALRIWSRFRPGPPG